MKKVTRRYFIKTLAGFLVIMTVGWYVITRLFRPIQLFRSEKSLPEREGKGILVVSDVDAHSQCAMRVSIKDNKVIDVQGVPEDPESKGELTIRDRHIKDFLHAPDRLKHPLKRVGKKGEGKWQRISWDEALSLIADKFSEIKERYGAEAICFHHGHYHSGDIIGTYLPRLANLIGTPNVFNPSHVCHLPRVMLQYNYDFGMVVPPDVAHTKCLIIWGGNPKATNKPMEIAIKEARERGAKLIVIDPRKIDYARESDIHAQLRPGTDGALALGMLNVIIKEGLYDKDFVDKWTVGFEELKKHIQNYSPKRVEEITWVPDATIEKMARMYATTKPACISPRNALDQHTNASVAIRAINALMAITGNIDVKGGNVITVPISMGIEDLKAFNRLPDGAADKKIGADKCLYSKISETWPSALTPLMWDAINDGRPYPIKGMLVMAANPAVTCANSNVVVKALKKLDFLLVVDLFMTPTAELADIILPASSFLETTRFVTYDTHADHGWNYTSRIALSPKVVEPLWDSWPDWKILCELGRRMGYSEYFPWKTEEEAIDHILKPLGITCEELEENPQGFIVAVPPLLFKKFKRVVAGLLLPVLRMTKLKNYPDMYRKYETLLNGFLTPSKKIELYSERLKELGYDPLPVYREPAESPVSQPELAKEYPLILIAGTKLSMYTHSMMRNIPNLHEKFPRNLLEINPETSDKLGIKTGDTAKISSPRGSIMCAAEVTDRIDPRVVHLYHGFKESNCNVLTDHKAFDPITGSTGLKSLLCKVEKAAAI